MARFLVNQMQSMMKDGVRVQDEPVLKNIEACKEITQKTRTSLGPDGLNKMVINHLGKQFVTHDAFTILKELEVEHPAAKLLVMGSKSMQEEVGDGTNVVMILAGELLNQAEQLIRMGIHTTHIVEGYTKASEAALQILTDLVVKKVDDMKNFADVKIALKTAIGSKQAFHNDLLAGLVAEACIAVCPSNAKSFNVDNVRVAKLEGLSVAETSLIHGFVLTRSTEGTIKEALQCKIAVYNCAIDNASTDTKGKVDITTAAELKEFSKTEENSMEKVIAGIARSGAKVVVSSQAFGDLAIHFLEQNGLMAIKVPSKFDLRRLCAAVNALQIMSLDAPTAEELGRCDSVKEEEIGGKKAIIFRQDHESSKLATIVVRGPTQNILDDVERAIDNGVNCYKALGRDGGLVAGGGGCEMELAKRLTTEAESTPDIYQIAMRKFAQSFEIIPYTLAEVSGHNATNVITSLMADHQNNKSSNGLAIEDGTTKDMLAAGILDLYLSKFWAIKFATEAAVTVLKVDQIIMAKPAGGPKAKDKPADDED